MRVRRDEPDAAGAVAARTAAAPSTPHPPRADYVLVFYPLDFTFVCPTELIAYSERAAEFEAAGAKVLGISVDSKFSHKAWVDMPRECPGCRRASPRAQPHAAAGAAQAPQPSSN